MLESDKTREAREALERIRELSLVSDQLREESKRLAEETEVLERAQAILRSRRQRAGK